MPSLCSREPSLQGVLSTNTEGFIFLCLYLCVSARARAYMCAHKCVHTKTLMWTSEDSWWEWVLSFHHGGSWDLNSGIQACPQASVPTQPSRQPSTENFKQKAAGLLYQSLLVEHGMEQ